MWGDAAAGASQRHSVLGRRSAAKVAKTRIASSHSRRRATSHNTALPYLPESGSGHPEPGSPLRNTVATKGRVAAWPLSDSRDRKGRFTSSTGGSGVAGTAACSRGRSAPATPRDVADRTGANGPERAATDNMATAAPNT